jgi:Alkaline phosphatase PhoX/Calx-beta domain
VNPDPSVDGNWDGPDNISISQYGGVTLAEDGDGINHLVGVTDQGKAYPLARNDLNDSEFTGPTCSVDARILFASIQSPGITFAITGPWGRPSNEDLVRGRPDLRTTVAVAASSMQGSFVRIASPKERHMGTARRFAGIIGTVMTLCALGVLPAAPAALAAQASTVITVGSASGYEYLPTCSNTAPYPCGPTALSLQVPIYSSRMYNHPITIGWEIFGGTATAGQDYTGPTSGTVTIAGNTVNTELSVPLVNDGVSEPNETFNVRLTSASVPADLSSIGTETILDGSRIPADCTLSKNAPDQEALTCTNRPADQRWYLIVFCHSGWGDPEIRGNDVIGNGTSAGTCGVGQTVSNGAYFVVY